MTVTIHFGIGINAVPYKLKDFSHNLLIKWISLCHY